MGEGGGRGRQRERGWVREVGEGDSERKGVGEGGGRGRLREKGGG